MQAWAAAEAFSLYTPHGGTEVPLPADNTALQAALALRCSLACRPTPAQLAG